MRDTTGISDFRAFQSEQPKSKYCACLLLGRHRAEVGAVKPTLPAVQNHFGLRGQRAHGIQDTQSCLSVRGASQVLEPTELLGDTREALNGSKLQTTPGNERHFASAIQTGRQRCLQGSVEGELQWGSRGMARARPLQGIARAAVGAD